MKTLRIAIYYRDLPDSLVDHVEQDGHMRLSKDGVMGPAGRRTPRCTIRVDSADHKVDGNRVAALENLLKLLLQYGQIVDYNVMK